MQLMQPVKVFCFGGDHFFPTPLLMPLVKSTTTSISYTWMPIQTFTKIFTTTPIRTPDRLQGCSKKGRSNP